MIKIRVPFKIQMPIGIYASLSEQIDIYENNIGEKRDDAFDNITRLLGERIRIFSLSHTPTLEYIDKNVVRIVNKAGGVVKIPDRNGNMVELIHIPENI